MDILSFGSYKIGADRRSGASLVPTIAAAGGGTAAASAAASYGFHRLGPPNLPHAQALRATTGTAIELGLLGAVLVGANQTGLLHGGERSNGLVENVLLGAATAAVVGWNPLFHGRTQSNWQGLGFNMLLGGIVGGIYGTGQAALK